MALGDRTSKVPISTNLKDIESFLALFGLELVLECCAFDFGTLGTFIFFTETFFGSNLTFIYWLMQDGTNCGIDCSVSAVLLKLYLRLLHLVFVLLKWEGNGKKSNS